MDVHGGRGYGRGTVREKVRVRCSNSKKESLLRGYRLDILVEITINVVVRQVQQTSGKVLAVKLYK